MRIVDYALVPDGGTQVLDLELDDGEILMIGLDGRMDSPPGGKQLFIGGAPDRPDARLLRPGGTEEARLIALLEQWLDRTQGFLRREALMDADVSCLEGQDLLDRLAIEFIQEVRNRELDGCS